MRRLLVLLLAVPWAGSGQAQTSVYSPRADSTSITIYRDGIAQITETRRVELPAGPVTLMLQGVVETVLPQSAVITGLDRVRLENNYDYDALTPQSLIERSVGKQVTVVRTDRVRGTQTRSLATIVSAGNGVVLRFDEGTETLHCSGLPERMEFAEVPGELTSKPVLSVKLAAGAAGPRMVTVSYLAQRFTWSADYVARLNAASDQLEMLGWVSLANGTDTSFRDAQVQVVAGRISILGEWEGGSRPGGPFIPDPEGDASDSELPLMLRLPACHPPAPVEVVARSTATTTYGSAAMMGDDDELEEVQITGSRIVSREELGDYKLYRIDWPTDLNAHQSKQAAFMHAEHVEVERVYRVQFPLIPAIAYGDSSGGRPGYMDTPVSVGLRWRNLRSSGLGEPMPAGTIVVLEQGAEGDLFAGQARIDDQPAGSLVEFDFARALNLSVENAVEALPEEDSGKLDSEERIAKRVSHRLINHKNIAVKVEVQPLVVQFRWSSPDIRRASQRSKRKNGDALWVVTVAAGGEQRLSYEIRSEELEQSY